MVEGALGLRHVSPEVWPFFLADFRNTTQPEKVDRLDFEIRFSVLVEGALGSRENLGLLRASALGNLGLLRAGGTCWAASGEPPRAENFHSPLRY